MPAISVRHRSSPANSTQPPPHFRCHDDMLALAEELGCLVSWGRWQRADCCDAVVAHGAVGWVLSGLICKSRILESGQRRIVDLMMPGDFFGLREDDARLFSFDATENSTLTARIGRNDFNTLVATRPALCQLFFESACRTIARLETHILVQGRTTSTQKVASYLLSMSRRLTDEDDAAVTLPVSRYDIADHVGIAVETVSRAITELRRRGVIELETPRCLCIKGTREIADSVPKRP
jgi:CRP-like cAMP-binding protein